MGVVESGERHRLAAETSTGRIMAERAADSVRARLGLCKRELPDDPEEIVRRIADCRADDKHDSLYYARLTVSKLQVKSRASGESTPST
jgi:hypothetical protein